MQEITTAQQIAADALTNAVVDRQLYVLKGVASINPKVDHEMLKEIWQLAAEVEKVGYPMTVSELLKAAEAIALERALLA